MNFQNNGLSIWFDTDDAPAPQAASSLGDRWDLIIGVEPRSPNNLVLVNYRVNAGDTKTLRASELPGPWSGDTQYFRVTFPKLPPGATVKYLPFCQSAGRQVPAPSMRNLSASFRVPDLPSSSSTKPAPTPHTSPG